MTSNYNETAAGSSFVGDTKWGGWGGDVPVRVLSTHLVGDVLVIQVRFAECRFAKSVSPNAVWLDGDPLIF